MLQIGTVNGVTCIVDSSATSTPVTDLQGTDLGQDCADIAARNAERLSNLYRGNGLLSVYAAGTAYQLTNAQAAVDFGTTDPALTISAAGPWLLRARLVVNYNAATFAAVRNLTAKLRRTNNTAADVTGATTTVKTQIVTTLTGTFMVITLPEVVYQTANADDAIALYAGLDTAPTAGSLDVVEASIIAIPLAR